MWYLYIVRCRDGTLYTGITTDLDRRVATHNKGKGGKYTRSRMPVTLAFSQKCRDKSEALVCERIIKRLRRREKLWIIRKGIF